MYKCEVCNKNLYDSDFLKSGQNPLYWRLINGTTYMFCGPQHCADWHLQQKMMATSVAINTSITNKK